jgi:hypothetical protein
MPAPPPMFTYCSVNLDKLPNLLPSDSSSRMWQSTSGVAQALRARARSWVQTPIPPPPNKKKGKQNVYLSSSERHEITLRDWHVSSAYSKCSVSVINIILICIVVDDCRNSSISSSLLYSQHIVTSSIRGGDCFSLSWISAELGTYKLTVKIMVC